MDTRLIYEHTDFLFYHLCWNIMLFIDYNNVKCVVYGTPRFPRFMEFDKCKRCTLCFTVLAN